MNASAIAPSDLDEAALILTQAARRSDAVAFLGGGTEMGFGYPAERVDLVVDTKNLSRIVEYAPADMVVEVEAGCTLAALQAALAPHRQRLAIDPPLADRATVGGVLATNAFGPLRARFGTLRDLIVGVSLVRADGVRVRGGGKVVKNVAGFDLPKIAVGSLGTLGMIATATFRLHPIPDFTRTLCIEACAPATLRALARAMIAAQLEPSAYCAERAGGGFDAYVRFEGFPSGVDEQCTRFSQIAQTVAGRMPSERSATDIPLADERTRCSGTLRLRVAVAPSVLDAFTMRILPELERALPGARCTVYPSLGIAFVGADAREEERARIAVAAARDAVETLAGNLVVLEAPLRLRASLDVYGTLPQSFPLMQALKLRFDPDRRLNRGRFVGGL